MKETSKILAGFGSFLATLAALFVWAFFAIYPATCLAVDMQMNTFSMIVFWFTIICFCIIMIVFPSFYYRFLKVELYKNLSHYKSEHYKFEIIEEDESSESE